MADQIDSLRPQSTGSVKSLKKEARQSYIDFLQNLQATLVPPLRLLYCLPAELERK